MESGRYLTAQEAAERLGVSLPTLYAYVSRGLMRSEPTPGDNRARRYPLDDVRRLERRRQLRREPERAAVQALDWGAPVLSSSLTLIDGGTFYYRGEEALVLAQRAELEEVAALLWSGEARHAGTLFAGPPPRVVKQIPTGLGPVEKCQLALISAGASDLSALDLRPKAVADAGARILWLLSETLAGAPVELPLARGLATTWAADKPWAWRGVRAALVLSADHELNVSAFTARCTASSASSPYDVVSAGLAALKGHRHGGHAARFAALVQEAGTAIEQCGAGTRAQVAGTVEGVLAARLRRGEEIPGFGQPLYPQGDPRAQALLQLVEEEAPDHPSLLLIRSVVDAAQELTGGLPTLDVGLVALSEALELPAGSPLALFALGRTVGWIAHALEQYESGQLIRPRARYVGPPPS